MAFSLKKAKTARAFECVKETGSNGVSDINSNPSSTIFFAIRDQITAPLPTLHISYLFNGDDIGRISL